MYVCVIYVEVVVVVVLLLLLLIIINNKLGPRSQAYGEATGVCVNKNKYLRRRRHVEASCPSGP